MTATSLKRSIVPSRIRPICRHIDTLILRNYLGEVVRERRFPCRCGVLAATTDIMRRCTKPRTSTLYQLVLKFASTTVSMSGFSRQREGGSGCHYQRGKVDVDLTIAASGVKSQARHYNLVRLSPFYDRYHICLIGI